MLSIEHIKIRYKSSTYSVSSVKVKQVQWKFYLCSSADEQTKIKANWDESYCRIDIINQITKKLFLIVYVFQTDQTIRHTETSTVKIQTMLKSLMHWPGD